MQLRTYSATITTTGSAGSATGTGTITGVRPGFLEWVAYDFHASAPATTDVTGTGASDALPPSLLLFTSTNSATDALTFPRGAPVNTGGTAITNAHARIPIAGNIAVSVAQCDALTGAVVVTVGVSS